MFKIFYIHFQCQTLLPWLRFSITICLFNSAINNICTLPLRANVLFRSPLHLLSKPSPPVSSCTILHSISLLFYPPRLRHIRSSLHEGCVHLPRPVRKGRKAGSAVSMARVSGTVTPSWSEKQGKCYYWAEC